MKRTIVLQLLFCITCLFFLLISPLQAQLPAARLDSIYPAGGQQGTKVIALIAGVDLDESNSLLFSHPGITAVQSTVNTKGVQSVVPNRFEVTINKDVPVGIYEVRSSGRFGVSSPRSFVVSDRTEILETEPSNNSLEEPQQVETETVINGMMVPGNQDYFRFQGKQGERLIIRCVAEEIDSMWEPVLTLYNSKGKLLIETQTSTFHNRLLDFIPQHTDNYILRVHDLLHAEARYVGVRNNAWLYRITISNAPHIDYVFPPAGEPGSKSKYFLFGRNLPGSTVVKNMQVDGHPLERLEVEIALPKEVIENGSVDLFQRLRFGAMTTAPSRSTRGLMYRLTSQKQTSNAVFIGFQTAKPVLEKEPNNNNQQAQKLSIPCEVAGQFSHIKDRDWFEFTAKKGDIYQIEVISQRLGIGTDPVMVIQQLKADGTATDLATVDDQLLSGIGREGKLLQRATDPGRYAFNSRTDDPGYRFIAPADATYRILLHDLYHMTRGDARFVYRLSIRKEIPDFDVVATTHYPEDLGPQNRNRVPWSTLLRRGGTQRLDILAFRHDGFEGDIQVTVDGLPKGVRCSDIVLRKGQTAAPLILQATEQVKRWNGPIQIIATSILGKKTISKKAFQGAVTSLGRTARYVPRSRQTLYTILSVTEEEAPFQVIIGHHKTWQAELGKTIKIPVEIKRRGNFKGKIQLLAVFLPDKITSKTVNIPANKTTDEVAITVTKQALAGQQQVLFEIKTDVQYLRDKTNPKAKPRKVTMRYPASLITLDIAKSTPAGKK